MKKVLLVFISVLMFGCKSSNIDKSTYEFEEKEDVMVAKVDSMYKVSETSSKESNESVWTLKGEQDLEISEDLEISIIDKYYNDDGKLVKEIEQNIKKKANTSSKSNIESSGLSKDSIHTESSIIESEIDSSISESHYESSDNIKVDTESQNDSRLIQGSDWLYIGLVGLLVLIILVYLLKRKL